MVNFTGISSKQQQAIDLLQKHISLPDVEVAVAQSDQASISIKGEDGKLSIDLSQTSPTLSRLVCSRNSISRR